MSARGVKPIVPKRNGKAQAVTLPRTFTPQFLDSLDGRCTVARVLRQRFERVRDEVGATTLAKEALCRRLVFTDAVLESMESEAAESGKMADMGAYVQATNAMLGLARTLGLERRANDATDLQTYLRQKEGAE